MKSSIQVLIVCSLLGPALLYGETNTWAKIEALSLLDTPQGNLQLETYLRTLSRAEMLEAARECCAKAEKRIPEVRGEEGVLPVGIALAFFGTQEGRLTDAELGLLLHSIASKNEGLLFRETVLRLLRQRYWSQMTAEQRQQSRHLFLEEVSDQTVSITLRILSCQQLVQAMSEAHRRIIISDKNVRPLRTDRQKWMRLDDLLRKREITLEPDTCTALKIIRDEIENITPTLTKLSQDTATPTEVKDCAKSALKTLGDLPCAFAQ